MDALVCTWSDEVFPPFTIIDRVLLKILQERPQERPPNCPTAAAGVMVPTSSRHGAISHAHPGVGSSARATELFPPMSAADATIFGAVAHPMSRLRQLDYSQAVLLQLSRSRLASSNTTYESRWRLFASYCASRSRDPFFAPSLVVISCCMSQSHVVCRTALLQAIALRSDMCCALSQTSIP